MYSVAASMSALARSSQFKTSFNSGTLQPVVLARKELWSSGRPCVKLVKETNSRREVVKLGGTAGVWSPVPTVKCRWINDGFDLLCYFVEWFSAVFEFNSCILT